MLDIADDNILVVFSPVAHTATMVVTRRYLVTELDDSLADKLHSICKGTGVSLAEVDMEYCYYIDCSEEGLCNMILGNIL